MIRVKSFTERNPVVIGAVVVTLIATFTAGALLLNSGALADRYTVRARFSDSAGITPGSQVKVAGITSGAVESVRQAGTEVEVVLGVDAGIELPSDTRADIVVDTLLGSKSVRLVPGDEWDDLLQEDAVITETSTPTEALDLQNIGRRCWRRPTARPSTPLSTPSCGSPRASATTWPTSSTGWRTWPSR